MTHDEIIAMPAGREMDALIYKFLFPDKWTPDVSSPSWQDAYGFEETNYSTDIEAAWQVVEKLAKDGGAPVVAFEATGKWSCGSWFSGQTKATMAYAETAPLAISRAALLTTIRE